MKQKWTLELRRLKLVGSVALFWLSTCGLSALAQSTDLRPDTLAPRNLGTRVQPINGRTQQIQGGTQRGTNLFHSFSEFNVPEGRSVYFENPTGVTNILSRVTGANSSNIAGVLGVGAPGAIGAANLFLINPNGIIFGPNSRLELGGSFLASTASSLRFNHWEFSTTNPQPVPLLVIDVPIGLQFGDSPKDIVNRSSTNDIGLQVQPARTLALVGGNVRLEGGLITASNGRVELGGVAGLETIKFSLRDSDIYLDALPANVERADIRLRNSARISVDSGAINIQARSFTLDSFPTQISALGLENLNAGNITISASNSVELFGPILSVDRFSGKGDGGVISIETGRLSVSDRAVIEANTRPSTIGSPGNITIRATDSIRVRGSSQISAYPLEYSMDSPNSSGGSLIIETGSLTIQDGSKVRGRQVSVYASNLLELIGTSAENNLAKYENDRTSLLSETQDNRNAGGISITTGRLIVRDGASISARTNGSGRAANLTIDAYDSVELSGTSAFNEQLGNRFPSGLFSGTSGSGAGGDLTIRTGRLLVQDGALVSARTLGAGNGGNITVNASVIEALNGGQILTTTNSSGSAGNITLNATDNIILSGSDPIFTARQGQFDSDLLNPDGLASGVFTRTQGTGAAGSLTIKTGELLVSDGAQLNVSIERVSNEIESDAGILDIEARSVQLDRGAIRAITTSGNGGNIELRIQDLLSLRRNSEISTSAGKVGAGGNGGNITIDAPGAFILAAPLDNSDITANAFEGGGGRVQITAQGILGLVPRTLEDLRTVLATEEPSQLDPDRLQTNDVTAISQTNSALNGQVIVNAPDAVDPNQGLLNLPTDVLDATGLIAQGCSVPSGQVANAFTVTGRGGLPPTPREALRSSSVLADLGTPAPQTGNPSSAAVSAQPTSSPPAPIVEAQGWVKGANGEVILTAQAPTPNSHSPWISSTACRVP
ncbi:S-layer family protein [Leptolyngbya sp. FACHB-261]|uniref:beta strand repeat-containing protein n=1 Tax=Leptolyngbya sp. FACHB-261 TaxID=2692806 RepID=UPI00168396D2|nr:S-layer family protein [Leptolyngbya sp. FACHB-261]MBD2102043.1 S-layer family protein [Leptolyngbya sp. FACHB-261]